MNEFVTALLATLNDFLLDSQEIYCSAAYRDNTVSVLMGNSRESKGVISDLTDAKYERINSFDWAGLDPTRDWVFDNDSVYVKFPIIEENPCGLNAKIGKVVGLDIIIKILNLPS